MPSAMKSPMTSASLNQRGDLRAPTGNTGPVGGFSGDVPVTEELRKHLVEDLRLISLTLVPALVGIEELDVGQAVLLQVPVLDRREHVLAPVEVDGRLVETVDPALGRHARGQRLAGVGLVPAELVQRDPDLRVTSACRRPARVRISTRSSLIASSLWMIAAIIVRIPSGVPSHGGTMIDAAGRFVPAMTSPKSPAITARLRTRSG